MPVAGLREEKDLNEQERKAAEEEAKKKQDTTAKSGP